MDAARRSGPPAPQDPAEATVRVARIRVRDGRGEGCEDAVAREEPLEIRLGDAPISVVMRTPGHDEELVSGFLLTERVVGSAGELLSVRHTSVARDPDAADNVVRAVLAPGVPVDLEALRRNFFASSSCGVCGKATIESAVGISPPLEDDSVLDAEAFPGLVTALEAAQPAFGETGGLHAAGLFAPDGVLRVVREDVGRHNAVDKVVGWALRAGHVPLAGHVLLVSGRVSFEIVQKALAARIPFVAAVSAPSSLAVALAESAGVTLVAFLRGRSFNVYGRRERVRLR